MQADSDQLLLVVSPAMLCPECRSRLRALLGERAPEPPKVVEPPKPPAEAPKQRLLRISEAAELCSISKSKAYTLAATGELPTIRLGRSIRVPLLELLEHLARQGARPA